MRNLAPPGAVELTNCGLWVFREHDRWICIGVLFGDHVTLARRRAVEAIVNSLLVSRADIVGLSRSLACG